MRPNKPKFVTKSPIEAKIDNLLEVTLSSSDESEIEQESDFLDSQASEGEEDTPSEDSNCIIDLGERINSTESELSTDESYENNSFIDDNETHELLSGREYDIGSPEMSKTRILQISSDSDGIVRKKKQLRAPQVVDSSDDDDDLYKTKELPKKSPDKKIIILENIKIDDDSKVDVKELCSALKKCNGANFLIGETKEKETSEANTSQTIPKGKQVKCQKDETTIKRSKNRKRKRKHSINEERQNQQSTAITASTPVQASTPIKSSTPVKESTPIINKLKQDVKGPRNQWLVRVVKLTPSHNNNNNSDDQIFRHFTETRIKNFSFKRTV